MNAAFQAQSQQRMEDAMMMNRTPPQQQQQRKSHVMTADEFERVLENDVPTRITLSNNRLSDGSDQLNMTKGVDELSKKVPDEFDSDLDDEPKKVPETQSLADFLKSTGPPEEPTRMSSPPPPKKKKGLFKFGTGAKKKKSRSPPPNISTNQPKHVPLAVAAGLAAVPNNHEYSPSTPQQQFPGRQPQYSPSGGQQPLYNNNDHINNNGNNGMDGMMSLPANYMPQQQQQQLQPSQQQPQQRIEIGERGQSLNMNQFQQDIVDPRFAGNFNNNKNPNGTRYAPQQANDMYQGMPPPKQEVVVPARNISMGQVQQPMPEQQAVQNQYNNYPNNVPEDDDYYSDESEEFIEDQGIDELIMRNTEYNAVVDNLYVQDTAVRQRTKRRVRFDNEDDEISNPGMSDEEPDFAANDGIVGVGPRGSYHPRNLDDDFQPAIKQRQSSLGYVEKQGSSQQASQSKKTPISRNAASGTSSSPSNSSPLADAPSSSLSVPVTTNGVPAAAEPSSASSSTNTTNTTNTTTSSNAKPATRKKKIRHVQIQTRGAMMKDASTVTEEAYQQNSREDSALSETLNSITLENERLKDEMEENRVKFDKLSAQAYKKIKELLMERKMLDMEVTTLREQVVALQDANARNWVDENWTSAVSEGN